jgi:predicted neuraminidase
VKNEIVLQLDPSKTNCRNSEGAFARLSDGRLIFAYSRFLKGHGTDEDPADIAARFSDDDGRTWTNKDQIIIPNEGNQNVMSVSFLTMQDGSLGIFYVKKNGFHDCRTYLRRSSDDGKSWSKPTLVVQAPGYFVLNNDRVIRLKTGRIVVPVAYHRLRDELNKISSFDGRGIIMFYLSDDDGKTWHESADWFTAPSALQEPGVVELKDGRIWSWCRTGWGQQWSQWSCDGGECWTQPSPSTIMSPCSPASVKRIPSTGDLLMVWNDHDRHYPWASEDCKPLPPLNTQPGSGGRTPLVSAISQDEGRTWIHRRCLEKSPNHGFCYTGIYFTEDAVLLAYCAGSLDTGILLDTLRIRRAPIDWFYA